MTLVLLKIHINQDISGFLLLYDFIYLLYFTYNRFCYKKKEKKKSKKEGGGLTRKLERGNKWKIQKEDYKHEYKKKAHTILLQKVHERFFI